MERSKLYLIIAVIAIAIIIAAGYISGPGSPVQGTRPGYGQGVLPGQGQGAGQGDSAGPGAYPPVLLPMTDSTPLSATEAGDILFMREEEQMAYDLYTRWAGIYSVPVFANIAQSETQHINEVQLLIDRYDLSNNQIGNASTGYYNATIQSLHDSLAKQGDTSLTGAFEAGLAVEERDIADLDHALAGTTRTDVIQVWSNLRQGSENHRSAFLRQLGR
jgi:hypothetical protein